MALSFVSSSMFISLLLAILLTISTPSSASLSVKISSSVLNDICSKTENPPFCLNALKSDRRTATADLHGLAHIAIDVAKANGHKTHALVGLLVKHATNPRLKNRYSTCLENYENAIDDLERADEYLKSRDFGGASSMTSGAMTEAETCKDELEDGPPADPSSMGKRNKEFNVLSLAVLIICNRLGGSA